MKFGLISILVPQQVDFKSLVLRYEMSYLSQALQREKIAQKFHLVTEQIEAALSKIHYDKLNLSEEVREQVLLQPNLF